MQLLPSFWATLAWAMGYVWAVPARVSLSVLVNAFLYTSHSLTSLRFYQENEKVAPVRRLLIGPVSPSPLPCPGAYPPLIVQHNDNCRNIFVLAVEQHTHFIVHPLCDGLNDHSSHSQLLLRRPTFHVYIQQLAISLPWNASACWMKCIKILLEIVTP